MSSSSSTSWLSTPVDSDAVLTRAPTTFLFPPFSAAPGPPRPYPLSAPTNRPTTSRIINYVPGFDDFAELVMASERVVPCLTATPGADFPSRKKTRHHHSHRAKPSEPKSVAAAPVPTALIPWSEHENDAGWVTFIFGRFRPALARYSLPNPNPNPNPIDTVQEMEIIHQDASHSSPQTTT